MGDVTPVQSRDGVAEKKLSSDIEVVSTINKTRSGLTPLLLLVL
jgi:hypothetical protein